MVVVGWCCGEGTKVGGGQVCASQASTPPNATTEQQPQHPPPPPPSYPPQPPSHPLTLTTHLLQAPGSRALPSPHTPRHPPHSRHPLLPSPPPLHRPVIILEEEGGGSIPLRAAADCSAPSRRQVNRKPRALLLLYGWQVAKRGGARRHVTPD